MRLCSSDNGREVAPHPRRRIDGGGRNRESHFRAHSGLAPDLEVTSDQLRSLTHARHTKVPGSIAVERFRVDASAVVADTQLKLAVIVADLHFDPASACVPEGIAQGLAANPIDVVADDRAKR